MVSGNDAIVPGTDEPGVCSTPLATVDDEYCCDTAYANVERLVRICVGEEQRNNSE